MIETFFASLPNSLSVLRLWYLRCAGMKVGAKCSIARNVYFLGRVELGDGTAIANNCFLNGAQAGIKIGRKVMIAPNCVIVAFAHGNDDLSVPMIDQPWVEAEVIIEDDVWIGANCTILKGIRVGRGAVIGANAVVTKDVESFAIAGGVPARKIGTRLKSVC